MVKKSKKRSSFKAKSFGQYLRHRRDELSLKQMDIAKAIGVQSPDFISLVEQGLRSLSLDRIPSLAEVLREDPVELCKMALEEQYPVLASVLFKRSSNLSNPTTLGLVGTRSAAAKLMVLDPRVRDPILDMINSYYDKEMAERRVKKRGA